MHPVVSQLLSVFGSPRSIDAWQAPASLELTDRPRLSRRIRLRFDRPSSTHLLVAPERVLLLNESAAAVVFACNGLRTVQQIARYVGSGADMRLVTNDVHALFTDLWRRDFIELLGPPGV